jgi:hypothetical protein
MTKERYEILAPTLNIIFIITIFIGCILGYFALFFYLLLLRFIYPIIISMQANNWEMNDIAYRETKKERLIVYIDGIPVREERDNLQNILFRDSITMKNKLVFAAKLKIICNLAILIIAIQNLYINTYFNTSSTYGAVYGFLTLFIVLYCLIKSLKLYNISKHELWHVNSSIIKNTLLHSAYIIRKKTEFTEYRSYLKILLS